jgi:hypothetical protein
MFSNKSWEGLGWLRTHMRPATEKKKERKLDRQMIER